MGGTTFEDYCSAERASTAEQAYDILCREADHRSGMEGYTGEINVTGGFRLHTTTVMTQEDARDLWESLLHSDRNPYNDKWGPCMCVPVGEGKTATRTITKTFELPAGEYVNTRTVPAELLQAGERVTDVEVISQSASYKHAPKRNRGKATRMFVVVGHRGSVTAEKDTLDEAIAFIQASRDQAIANWKARIEDHARRGWNPPDPPAFGEAHIREEVRRGGLPAATFATPTVRKVKAKITFTRTTQQPTKVTGYYFAGWASC